MIAQCQCEPIMAPGIMKAKTRNSPANRFAARQSLYNAVLQVINEERTTSVSHKFMATLERQTYSRTSFQKHAPNGPNTNASLCEQANRSVQMCQVSEILLSKANNTS
jgi:hypothetical protein